MTIFLLLLSIIVINTITIVCACFLIKGFTHVADKFRLLSSNLKKTGTILEGTSFFGHPDKNTSINKNFAYVFSYGYVLWLVGGFIFSFSLILFDLMLTGGIIILMLQSL